eukprot:TRINITY_DN14296_c0_g1_i1.p1 TRINITY_DN14296_c0_g1~~TRINITY_DN14296_c0_g1_i1.p1  ORF type:complete len:68 (-),score=1.80 TRINITY_DN14296_c0_g1_i1:59-262(-)
MSRRNTRKKHTMLYFERRLSMFRGNYFSVKESRLFKKPFRMPYMYTIKFFLFSNKYTKHTKIFNHSN